MKTSLFDLHSTARTAAIAAQEKPEYQRETIRREAFDVAGHDPLDWPQYKEYFDDNYATVAALSKAPSPATKAWNLAQTKPAAPAGTPAANA